MRLETASWIATLLVGASSAASVATYVAAGRLFDARREAWSRYHETAQEATRLARGSDVLTDAVRAYAATGEDRYRVAFEEERLLTRSRDVAIEHLRALGTTPAEMALIETAKRNSDALIELEHRAFAAAAEGDRSGAIDLVYGLEYVTRKASITEPLQLALRSIEDRQRDLLARASERASQASQVALATLALNVGVCLFALIWLYRRRVVRPLGEITAQARRLVAGERGIRFGHGHDAAEIADLARVLEDYGRARDELEARDEDLRRVSGEQQAIFDTATSGIVLTRERVVVRCNRRLDDMLGHAPGEQVGKPVRAWYPDDASYESVGREMYEHLARGETHVREQLFQRKDGTRFWARIAGRAVDPARLDRGVVAIVDDITAERAAVEELRRARAVAEDAARTKSTFLANMSHEIRTPMNAIIGMAELAQRTDLTPRQRDYLTKIQGASQHLLGVINDILDVSKIEAGKMTVERIPFDLDQVLERVTTLIATRAAARGLEFLVEVGPDVPPHLVGDPLRLGQILVNYAGNSVKFTEQGEIVVRVSVERLVDGEVVLRFSVQDTGVGFSEAQRSHLFRSFEQADASTTRKYGGTGLGLAISKRLAELMGGEVGADGAPGAGATFWFTARLGIGEARVRTRVPDADLRGRRMLVADDNDHAREIMVDTLRSMGFEVGAVPSGGAAVEEVSRAAAAGSPYAVALLDWQMPGMDGIAAAAAIRALPLQPPRMILVTAYGHDELARSARDAGLQDVLFKPVTPSQLLDAIMRAMGRPTGRPGSGRKPAGAAADALGRIAGARVLLAEDNEMNQQVAAELLRQAGLSVDVVGDGAAAVARAREGRYDLVLMDLQMPVMDGLEATREIRRSPALADLPVVAMTANAMAGDRERCLQAGMNDHMAKPIEPDLLWATLLRWVRDRPGLGAPRPARPASPTAAAAAAPPVAPTQLLSALRAIADLDVDAGMRLAAGDERLYLSIVERYLDGQAQVAQRLDDLRAAGDAAGAERLAHTLKGTSRQIGAEAVARNAEELEAAIHRGAEPGEIAAIRRLLEPRLAALLDALSAALPARGQAPAQAVVDATRLREACVRLARALADADVDSHAVLDESEAILRGGLGEAFDAVAAATRAFDFPAAHARLLEAAARKGIDLTLPPEGSPAQEVTDPGRGR